MKGCAIIAAVTAIVGARPRPGRGTHLKRLGWPRNSTPSGRLLAISIRTVTTISPTARSGSRDQRLKRNAIFTNLSQSRSRRYSANFFTYADDLDGDGWTDLLVLGFPGAKRGTYWFKNPGKGNFNKLWPRFEVSTASKMSPRSGPT